MRDVGLGVKFLFGIDTAFDLATGNGCNDGSNTGEEIVFLFFSLDTVIEQAFDATNAIIQCALGSQSDLVAHEDANLLQLLPFAIDRQQSANFKVASGNVKLVRDVCPFGKVVEYLPVVVAVVNDE